MKFWPDVTEQDERMMGELIVLMSPDKLPQRAVKEAMMAKFPPRYRPGALVTRS